MVAHIIQILDLIHGDVCDAIPLIPTGYTGESLDFVELRLADMVLPGSWLSAERTIQNEE